MADRPSAGRSKGPIRPRQPASSRIRNAPGRNRLDPTKMPLCGARRRARDADSRGIVAENQREGSQNAQEFHLSPRHGHGRVFDRTGHRTAGGASGRRRQGRRPLRHHLRAAQSVRRRVRAHSRQLCREARRRQADGRRDQRHDLLARSAFALHEREGLERHAGDHAWRVRRARHRGHDGRRPRQGGGADRRHARRQGRHHVRRRDHPDRR